MSKTQPENEAYATITFPRLSNIANPARDYHSTLGEIAERARQADRHVGELASSRCEKWRVSIPVQADDSDMILGQSLRHDLPAVVSALICAHQMIQNIQTAIDHCGDDANVKEIIREIIANG